MIEKEELDRFIASCKDEQAELLMTLGRIPGPPATTRKSALRSAKSVCSR